MASSNEIPRTILRSIIEDSIRAFPDDAHQKVLQYLLESGLDESHSLRFRQAWSKVVLGSQAFGRNNKSKMDPILFSEELIRELSYSDEQIARLITASSTCMKLERNSDPQTAARETPRLDSKNARDTVAAMDAVTAVGENLSNALRSLYETAAGTKDDAAETNSIQLLESIGLFRKSLRGTRLHWGGSLLPADVVFLPLDSVIHGLPDITKGKIDMQLRSERQDLNEYMSTDELIGVVVSNKQSVHQERGWNAYLALHELLSSKGLNLFPLPVGVHREVSNLSTTFAFESAAGCASLVSLLGPALSTYLRRIPHVVHRWCAQLAEAHRALLRCSGSLMKPIRVDSDVFIRDNGHLLIGNVAFDASPPGNRAGYGAMFLRSCCEILQRVLCLSREEGLRLVDEGGAEADRGDSAGLDDVESAEVGQLSGIVRAFPSTIFVRAWFCVQVERGVYPGDQQDIVLAVVVGSTLDLTLTGHDCTTVDIVDARVSSAASVPATATALPQHLRGFSSGARVGVIHHVISGAQQAAQPSSSPHVLSVNAAVSVGAYSDYAAIQALSPAAAPGNGGSLCLSLRTLKPGVISLHLTARVLVDDSSSVRDGAPARYRRRGCRLRVVIVSNYNTESVLLQELIGHLEEARKWRNPKILLHAQLFQRPQQSEEEEGAQVAAGEKGAGDRHSTGAGMAAAGAESVRARQAVLVNARDVQRGWQDIKRVIANHGALHTPKVA